MSNALHRAASAQDGTARPAVGAALMALITRLHFYVGLFVGPFILVAAVTGTLFVLTLKSKTASMRLNSTAMRAGRAPA